MKRMTMLVALLHLSCTPLFCTSWLFGYWKTEETLHQAAEKGDTNACKRLLKQGANIDAKDDKKWTPLHLATKNGQQNTCALLISKGANINAKEEKGCTPLHIAVLNDYKNICVLLLQQGANIHLKNLYQETPLDLTKDNDIKQTIINYEEIKISGYLATILTTHGTPQVIIGLILTFSLGQHALPYLPR